MKSSLLKIQKVTGYILLEALLLRLISMLEKIAFDLKLSAKSKTDFHSPRKDQRETFTPNCLFIFPRCDFLVCLPCQTNCHDVMKGMDSRGLILINFPLSESRPCCFKPSVRYGQRPSVDPLVLGLSVFPRNGL